MLVKDWPGMHHVDIGGNVIFLQNDSADEIQQEIQSLLDCPKKYQRMKAVAAEQGMKTFSYAAIAQRAIEA